MEIYSHPDIPEILQIPGNSACCDCNSEKPKWASLNNGVFLCLKCAGIHRSLGVEISTIRSLQIDSWTDKQILYLSKGGNEKFKKFLSEYQIDSKSQIDLKYKSKAADYYRKSLKNEIEKTTDKDYKEIELIKPNLEVGKEIIDIKKGQEEVNNSNVIGAYNEQKKEEGFFGVMGSFFNSVKKTAGDVAGKITKEIDDLKIGDKLKETGESIVGFAKAGGNFIKDKSQQAINSNFVQGITKTAESGINSVIEKTKTLLKNDKDNQKQNLNPNLLKNNEIQAENGLKNDNIQMSDNINDNNNNIGNINNVNDIVNEGEIKNEENQKKEEIKNDEILKKEEKENEPNPLEENKIENESKNNENVNNVIENKEIKEENIKHEPEIPQAQ
jgi:ADP-ribosylation factor GTPase-activating protein 1